MAPASRKPPMWLSRSKAEKPMSTGGIVARDSSTSFLPWSVSPVARCRSAAVRVRLRVGVVRHPSGFAPS